MTTVVLRIPDPSIMDVIERGELKDTVAGAVRWALRTNEPIGVDILPDEPQPR